MNRGQGRAREKADGHSCYGHTLGMAGLVWTGWMNGWIDRRRVEGRQESREGGRAESSSEGVNPREAVSPGSWVSSGRGPSISCKRLALGFLGLLGVLGCNSQLSCRSHCFCQPLSHMAAAAGRGLRRTARRCSSLTAGSHSPICMVAEVTSSIFGPVPCLSRTLGHVRSEGWALR